MKNICKVIVVDRMPKKGLPQNVEALCFLEHRTVVVYLPMIDNDARKQEVIRHEVIGHMVPRVVMTKEQHHQWLMKVYSILENTFLIADLRDLYRTDDRATLADEAIARIAETPYSFLDEWRAAFGNAESKIRCKLNYLVKLAENACHIDDVKYKKESEV